MYYDQNVYQKNNHIVRWIISLSLIVISLTLLISWLLWFFLYSNTIISIFKRLTFKTFSILTLSISGLAFLFAIPTMFLTRKTTMSNIFSLLDFLLSLVIIGGTYFLFSHLDVNIWVKNDFASIFAVISKFLVLFLPWIITIFATIFLFVNSFLHLVIIKDHEQEKSLANDVGIKNQIPLMQIVNQTTANEKLNDNNTIKNKPIISSQLIDNLNKLQSKVRIISDVTMPLFNSFDLIKNECNHEISITEDFLNKVKEKNKGKNSTIVTKLTKKEIKEVWEQGEVIPGVNKDLYRKDYAGAWIFFLAYIANPDSTTFSFQSYSWTIVNHKLIGEEDNKDVATLKPMNVLNALSKGENYPKWKTKVSSCGNENILKEQIWSS